MSPKHLFLQSLKSKRDLKLSSLAAVCSDRVPDQEGHLNTLKKLHGPTISPSLSSRRRRQLSALESSTDPQGSITITITQMCTYTSWLVRDSSNCMRQMVWSCTLYKCGAVLREQHIYNKSWNSSSFLTDFHEYRLYLQSAFTTFGRLCRGLWWNQRPMYHFTSSTTSYNKLGSAEELLLHESWNKSSVQAFF